VQCEAFNATQLAERSYYEAIYLRTTWKIHAIVLNIYTLAKNTMILISKFYKNWKKEKKFLILFEIVFIFFPYIVIPLYIIQHIYIHTVCIYKSIQNSTLKIYLHIE